MINFADDDAVSHSRDRLLSIAARQKWRKGTLVVNATLRMRQQRAHSVGGMPMDPCYPATRRPWTVERNIGEDDDGQDDDIHLALNIPVTDSVSVDKLQELVQKKSLALLRELGDLPGVAESLGTDLRTGLDNDPQQLKERRSLYGSNCYPTKSTKPFWRCVWEATHDATLMVLMVLSLLSIVFGILTQGAGQGWQQGGSIAISLLVVIAITAISDYWQSIQLRGLGVERTKNIQVQVIRGSSCSQAVSIFDLVVGDVVLLKTGNVIPSDGLLIEGQSLTVNEASLNGGSNAVDVDKSSPFLLSGCKVTSGHGTMLVTGVGTNTEWGKIMSTLSENTLSETPTPLQARLRALSRLFHRIGILVSLLVLLVLLLHYFIGTFRRGVTTPFDIVYHVIEILITAITNTTVVVPHALPLAMTIMLTYSTKKMMANQALVRRFTACETMGSVTVICTDKTGTLTLNQMSVVDHWMAGRMCTEFECMDIAPTWLLLEGIAVNGSGNVYIPPNGGPPQVTGSPTEKAALDWGLKLGMDYQRLHQASSVVHMEAFNSEKKCTGVAIRPLDDNDATIRVHWKGAAEIILGLCTKFYATNGDIAMSMEKRGEIQETINRMAASSLRCIAFAYRPLRQSEELPEEIDNWKLPEDELSLLAIVGMKDSCRPGVSEAINECQKAGIAVRMVTGDHLATSLAIAKECKILTHEESLNPLSAIESTPFFDQSEEEKIHALSLIKVMARSSPNHKLLMVKTLQEMGEIVAVMGDGTNDALALQEADVGLTMGAEGTEVTKDSSDIIILDNFKTVVHVVRWGRSIYANIQKFFQFQLTNSVAFLIVTFITIVPKGGVPLTVVQSLWLDVVMDFVGAWALTTEHPTNELMHNPPIGLSKPLVTNIMWRNILGQAAYQIAILLTLQFRGKQILNIQDQDDTLLNTIIFNSFILCQLFNMVNARRPTQLNVFEGLYKCHLFLGIIGVTLVLQVIIIEHLGSFTSTTNLKWNQWLICVAIGFLSWPIAFVCKFIPIPKRHFLNTNTDIPEYMIELITEHQDELSTMPM